MKIVVYLDGKHDSTEVKNKILSVLPDAKYMIFDVEDENALTIIKKQQAEIERLTKETMNMTITIETCQAEAIKEYKNKVKNDIITLLGKPNCTDFLEHLDYRYKEMVGEE